MSARFPPLRNWITTDATKMRASELRDLAVVRKMRVREVTDAAERERLWKAAVAAYPPYAEYQTRTTRVIPIFLAEPVS